MKPPWLAEAVNAYRLTGKPLPELPSSQRFLALYDGRPSSGGVEVSFPGYQRQRIDEIMRQAGADASNVAQIRFPKRTDAGAAARVSWIGILTAATAGTIVEESKLDEDHVVLLRRGDVFYIDPQDLILSEE